LVAGLDVGTTGCKVTVFTPEGNCLGRESRTYATRRGGSVHELDAEALAAAVLEAFDAAAAKFGKIGAMGVTSFGEAFVLTDGGGRPPRRVAYVRYSRPRHFPSGVKTVTLHPVVPTSSPAIRSVMARCPPRKSRAGARRTRRGRASGIRGGRRASWCRVRGRSRSRRSRVSSTRRSA
ncbi:MAG: hypothetical protein IJS46_03610, partial [Kiritimatiellae bacterium]|nr:hypothetical protein [Kiritimatiellia bacterium]